ncbi:MAG: 3-phosphoinositide dependent protein kinase-1 [Pycnora praestabilis]|nr:MAG: 3-phosphoinositide dependent protein kinase-1 [Pycnora praestabilis]
MNGDLSLSQSFGGLRIANPDDEDSTPSLEDAAGTTSAPQRQSSDTSSTTAGRQQQPSEIPLMRGESKRIDSRLDSNAASFGTNSRSTSHPSPPLLAKQPSYSERNSHRQSMPINHQGQQQTQFPLHSSPIQQPQRYAPPAIGNSRPTSVIYKVPPANGSATGITRDGSYRLKSESSRSSISGTASMPRRSSSRGAGTAMQAGVPIRENSHSERTYRHSQQVGDGNGPLPPRRSSRGTAGGSSTMLPLSEPAPTSGMSPYGLEGGPLPSSEDWKDRGAAKGVQKDFDSNGRPISKFIKKGVKDFNFGRTLGEGSYSTVLAATDRQTLKEYAIKVLDKRHIIKEKKVKYVNIEKDTLNRLTDHPGVVRLYYTFQDERSLYFVLDVASGGELLGVLKRMTTFDEECTKFYGAQILDAVDYMHARGVIHRDLKPENVLLDDQMHVKITDFGTAKILDVPRSSPRDGTSGASFPSAGDPMDGSEDNRAQSFVGTAEYVSPELLTDKNACKASDLWAFGCIIYQLLAGRPPFKAGNEYQTFQKIVALDYEFPNGFPEVARDLVDRLLVLDPAKRLSIEHIKNHQFFDGITWGRSLWKQKAPRLRSYTPPSQEPIKLNGNGNGSSYPPNISQQSIPKAGSAASGQASNGMVRPSPRIITELPPPSQLDLDWSPVLTRTNERILKLGNLLVLSAPAPHSPNSKSGQNSETPPETSNRFSRFFGGNNTKKRQRLVMVTSGARIIMAAAGGEEKKMKTEVSLLAPGCAWRSTKDAKGFAGFCVDTREKHYTFEDPKPSSSDPEVTVATMQEWLDAIERSKEIAVSQSMANSYSSHDVFRDLPSSLSSPASTLGGDNALGLDNLPNTSNKLTKSNAESESNKGRKRFSKRQSRSGLAAVF